MAAVWRGAGAHSGAVEAGTGLSAGHGTLHGTASCGRCRNHEWNLRAIRNANPPTKLPVQPSAHLQHPRAAEIFERDLAPFQSQSALRFWRPRLRYFATNDGLYYHGGMVST